MSPTAGWFAAAHASTAAASSLPPIGWSRCGASVTTYAKSRPGYECGIGLAGFNEIEEGDIIESFTHQIVSRVATG